MEIGFRWYGPSDSIPLKYINQIPGVDTIVGSFFDISAEELIPENNIKNLKMYIEEYGFSFRCIESLPVHENIKLGKEDRDKYIEIWCENIRTLSKYGIDVICYNFMLAFDWIRTDLNLLLADDSVTNGYNHQKIGNLDPYSGLPDWSQLYTPSILQEALEDSQQVSESQFWSNFSYFIKAVVPVAEECGVKLALHPDDPPWDAFGIIRPLGSKEGLERVLQIVDSPNNGIAFCTGTIAVDLKNDVYKMLKKIGSMGRINYLHVRNVLVTGDKEFHETAHHSDHGDLDMYQIMKIVHEIDYKGILRVDHGRNIWDEERAIGYGLYDRAIAVNYIIGLWEAITKSGT